MMKNASTLNAIIKRSDQGLLVEIVTMKNQNDMKEQLKQAIVFFAHLQQVVNSIDELKGTSIYKQSRKSLYNKVLKDAEGLIMSLYDHMDKNTELYFYKTVDMAEAYSKAIKNNNLDTFIMLLEELEKGQIRVIDENKHQKIINQLDVVK